eukprot:2516481-Rhodomonas_salina.1
MRCPVLAYQHPTYCATRLLCAVRYWHTNIPPSMLCFCYALSGTGILASYLSCYALAMHCPVLAHQHPTYHATLLLCAVRY